MRVHKPVAVATTVAAICASGAVLAQQQPLISAQSAAQKLMAVPGSKYPGRMHVLPATMETTQWGWFDNAELPRLIIDSGDTVAIESMSHSHGQLYPGRTIEELKKLRTDWPARGPMTLTGPIFVNGAEPGDTLQIKIQKIVPRPWGANFNVPGLFGQFPSRFPEGQVKYLYLDNEKKSAEFAPGLEIPLRPFPGTLGVARKEPGRTREQPLREEPAVLRVRLVPVVVQCEVLGQGEVEHEPADVAVFRDVPDAGLVDHLARHGAARSETVTLELSGERSSRNADQTLEPPKLL